MTDLRLYPNDGDDDVTRGLRELYAAPADEAYWNELEAMVMARIGRMDLGWWAELGQWMRPALVAAALLVITAGLALVHAQRDDTEVAYENILTPPPVPAETAVRPIMLSDRDATLQFVLAR